MKSEVSSKPPKISIIIPAYNEGERLPSTLKSQLAYLHDLGLEAEFIVVDDGSSDNTAALAEQCLAGEKSQVLVQAKNEGKGSAVRRGVLASEGEYILISDADGSTPIQELARLLSIAQSEELSLVIGSRRIDPELLEIKQPWYRLLMGGVFIWLVQNFLGIPVADSQCGFKLLEGSFARAVFAQMQIDRFSFDVELLYLTQKHSYSFREVPVLWRDDARSTVNVFRDPFIMFWDLVRIKLIHQ